MSFEQALKEGDLDLARAILDEFSDLPDTGGLWMPQCYADLAREYERQGREDDAIELLERAIELGWPRSDMASLHLRAGRLQEAAAIWAELKASDPDDVWLYNAAGLSYWEIGEHELAVDWLGQGIELAMRTDDPEGIINQLSDVRRQSLDALGRGLDELEERVGPFVENAYEYEEVAVSTAWFPAGEYETAIERWPSLAEYWADVPHSDYCARMDGNIKWSRSHGLPIRAVVAVVVEKYVAWCAEEEFDPEDALGAYAARRMFDGDAIPWPPGRNEPCWCGSGRKYKKCCGPAPARPMHDPVE